MKANWYIITFGFILLFQPNGIIAQKEIQLRIIPVDSVGISALKKERLVFKVRDSISAIKKLKEFSEYWIKKDFISISFDSIYSDSTDLKAYVYLGSRFVFDSINVVGIPPNLQKTVGIEDHKVRFKDFLKVRSNIISYYENNGFPFVQLKIDSLHIANERKSLSITIHKNGFFKIDSIVTKGNPKISRKYLLHEIQIKPGSTYNQLKIDQIDRIINDMSFLKQAKPVEIEFREGNADLYMYLKRNPANFFNGIIGFATDSVKGSSLQLTGDISLVLQNSFKIGEKIDLYWSKYGETSQNLRFGFQFPYIFILPVGVNCRLGLEKFQINYLNTELYFALNYEFSGKNGLRAFVQQKKSFLINNDTLTNVENLGFSSTITGLGFILDKSDYKPNPARGYYFDASIGYGNTTNDGQESKSIVELGFEGGVFIRAGKIFSFAFLNQSGGIFNQSGFYKNQLYKIGGTSLLRGFDEKSIFASEYSVFTIEPRLLLGKNSNLFIFTDIGWYQYKLPENTFSDTPLGFGAGMNIDTKAGIFKLIYAIGKQQGNPVKLSNSKVHFGFSTRF